MGGIFLAAVTALAVTYAGRLAAFFETRLSDPIDVVVEESSQCGYTNYFLKGKPEDYPPVPDETRLRDWARENGGVKTGGTLLRVTVSGDSSTDRPVVLQGLTIEFVRKYESRPNDGFAVLEPQCGSPLTERFFAVDLDTSPATVEANPPEDGITQQEPISFPYTVSGTDVEQFSIDVTAGTCNCEWQARLAWTSGDQSGEFIINDDGDPFRIHGTEGSPTYMRGDGPSNLERAHN